MLWRAISTLALLIASAGGTLAAVSAFHAPFRAHLVGPMIWLCGGAAALLFARMLLNPQCRKGIHEASLEIQGAQPFRKKWIGFLDPQWGLFGSRAGSRPLLAVRAFLFLEFLITLLMSGRSRPDLLLLVMASFAITMLLSLTYAGLNQTEPAS